MKYSQILLKTMKESPADENSLNAKLLIRGGFIRKEMAGVYSFLPLGLRVLRNIEQIVREEMEAVGASEILMPVLANKQNWEKTGRWNTMPVLYKMEMAGGRECALHPTHEECVTPLVQQYCSSPKDFPKCVYQTQVKFRNEPRAKSGLLRGREFLMKDAYSFHLSMEDFEKYYDVMTTAYHRIFKRLGIGEKTVFVAASGGDFSKFSHEFQTLSPIGEDEIFWDEVDKKWLNREIVPALARPWKNTDESPLPAKNVEGVGLVGVKVLADFLKIPVEKTTKTILFETEVGDVIAAVVRGEYEIDEKKLLDVVGCQSLTLATPETVKRVTGAEVGYAGVLGLPVTVRVIWDDSCVDRINFEMGANRTDHHTINLNFERDIPTPEQFFDIKVPRAGDLNPKSKKPYKIERAIEVGNIFPLSTKFSVPFNFSCDGKPVVMGCYGIGISRLMGTIAELFADDRGLVWPKNIAPVQIYLAPIGRDDAPYKLAEKIHAELYDVGVSVLLDDRRDKKIGSGTKFADAELLGIPQRVVLSERGLSAGIAEVVDRGSGKMTEVKLDELVTFLTK